MKRRIWILISVLALLLNAGCEILDETDGGDKQGDVDIEADADMDSNDGEQSQENEAEGEPETEAETENAEFPDPNIDGYLVAALHTINTIDYDGNEMSFYLLGEDGQWLDLDERILLHDRPEDAAFTPFGHRLLVVHGGGEILVFNIIDGLPEQANDISGDGYFSEILISGERAYLLDGNPDQYGGGLKVLDLKLDPPAMTEEHIVMHAPSGLAINPGGEWAVAFGGPVMGDESNTAIIDIGGDAIRLESFYDFWIERATVMDPGFSPDGAHFAAGNNSPFYEDAGVVKLFSFSESGEIAILDSTIVETPSAFVFSDDGRFLLVSALEDDSVSVFNVEDGALTNASNEGNLGLADDIAPLRKGPLAGHVIVAIYNALILFSVGDDGNLSETSRLTMSEGVENLIGGIAVGNSY